jgi:hypothetical protein
MEKLAAARQPGQGQVTEVYRPKPTKTTKAFPWLLVALIILAVMLGIGVMAGIGFILLAF